MTSSELKVSLPSESTLVLTLDRTAKRNALDGRAVEDFHAALDKAEADKVRLVCLRGAGVSFCTGFDLSNLDTESDGDLLLRFVRIEMLLNRLYNAPFVTMALAQGRVMGAGADLFAACDRRFIVDDAQFCFPGAGFGLVLGLGRLAERVGRDRAREFVRQGREIPADEAIAIGFAHGRIAGTEIDDLIARESRAASRLDRETVAALHAVHETDGAADLAHLTSSAARPGLKARIAAYRERVMQRKKPPAS